MINYSVDDLKGSSTKLPDWLTLITHWVSGGAHNGYSFPFLLGARAIKRGIKKATLRDARQLVDEIFNQPLQSFIVQVILCPDLGVPVFGLKRGSIRGKQFFSNHSKLPSIFIRQDLVDKWGDTNGSVITNIIKESEKPIREGHFSRSLGGEWTTFTRNEIDRINRLLDLSYQ